MPDDYKADRIVDTSYSRGNLVPAVAPSGITDGQFALIMQRAYAPAGFKGTIQLVAVEGSVGLKPYLDPIKTRIDDLETALLADSNKGDRIESFSLGTLQPETWTSFPAATGTIKDFKIFDSIGNDISSYLETRRSASGWEVFSLVRQDNLVFEYEIAPTGDSGIEKAVLPLLSAKTWTSLPAATGAVIDYKIFDSNVDISDYLEVRRINAIYQVFSLVDKINLQIEYEVHQ